MRSVVVASLLLTLGAMSVAAQGEFGDRAYALGAGISVVNDPPMWFTNAICPDRHPTRYQVSGAARLRGLVILKAAASRYSENPKLCIDGFVPPIPETGPYTARGRSTEADILGYPYWAFDMQLGADAYWQDALLGRASLGTMWIPSKHMVGFAGILGAGLRIPRSPLVISAGLEQQWLRVPYVDIVVEYLDAKYPRC